MKTLKGWQLEKLDWNDVRSKGYYNPPYILKYKGHEVIAPNGDSDYCYLFQEGNNIIFLSINPHYGYAGVTVYDNELTEINEYFSQNIFEDMGNKFFDYTSIYQAKILYNLLG